MASRRPGMAFLSARKAQRDALRGGAQGQGQSCGGAREDGPIQANHIFNTLDVLQTGFINKAAAAPLISKWAIPKEIVDDIWAKADADGDGRLSRLEFADAMVMFRKAVRDQQVDVPAEEAALANQYFDMLDRRKRGVIPGPALVNFFKQFGLSQQELVPICWRRDPQGNPRGLTKPEFVKAFYVVRQKAAAAGNGGQGSGAHAQANNTRAPQTNNVPPLRPRQRDRYLRIFYQVAPRNGQLAGERARELMRRSGLRDTQLATIWRLADPEQRGYLDARGFVIAMYLIRSVVSGRMTSIPSSLPQSIYDVASHIEQSSTAAPNATHGARASIARPLITIEQTAEAVLDDFFAEIRRNAEQTCEQSRPVSVFVDDSERIGRQTSASAGGRTGCHDFDRNAPLPAPPRSTSAPPGEISSSYPNAAGPSATRGPRRSEGITVDPHLSPNSIDLINPYSPPTLHPEPHRTSSAPTVVQLQTSVTPRSVPSELPYSADPAPTHAPQPPAPPPIPPQLVAQLHWDWDVTPEDKAHFDRFFDTLDPWRTGFVEGEAAAPFFSKSKLPEVSLAQIWHLADADLDGKLSREDFAVAMLLIQQTLAGKPIPPALAPSLVPPSRRPPGVPRQPSETRSPPEPEGTTSSSQNQEQTQATLAASMASIDLGPDDEPRSQTPPPPYTEWEE